MNTPVIELLEPSEFDSFFTYLNRHVSENGDSKTGYFQPLPRAESTFTSERASAFIAGFELAIGAHGWRRAWVARGDDRQILGHIDLRSHRERYAAHRCLLGMGVDSQSRQRGLGKALLAHAVRWAHDVIEWMDLQVMDENKAALALYQGAGFITTGHVESMFRLDGRDFGFTSMSLRLR
jgi:ribosomal protein S18 acetylase RimI-like enzyme